MALIRLVYEDGDVRGNAGAVVDDASILDNPEAVAEIAKRLVPALKVFVELERERIARKAAS